MAAPLIRSPDTTGQFLYGWQLLKSRSIAQTILTAANLTTNLRDVNFSESTVEFLDVSLFSAIQVQVYGTAANNAGSPTTAVALNLYGWSDNGPGYHCGTVSVVFGNFTSAATTGFHASANTHKSIRDAFDPATAYQGVDTFTETADYDGSITVPASQETDFPGSFIVSFANTRYKFFGVLVTSLGNVAATNVGAIYRPLAERSMMPYGT